MMWLLKLGITTRGIFVLTGGSNVAGHHCDQDESGESRSSDTRISGGERIERSKVTFEYSTQVWHRYEWNDRRYGQLKEVETWKRIWEIKERIEVRLR